MNVMLTQPQISIAAHLLPTLEPKPIRIALVGRDAAAREILGKLLGAYDDLVVDELELDDRLEARLRDAAADVVLSDASPRTLDLLPRLDAPAVILLDDASLAGDALAAGARGVLFRDVSPRRLHAALLAVSEGIVIVDEGLSANVMPHRAEGAELIEPLTHRELEVMQLLADGLTNKEIANRLGISDHTVKFHVNGILGKLGVETRTEAVVHAMRLGIVVL